LNPYQNKPKKTTKIHVCDLENLHMIWQFDLIFAIVWSALENPTYKNNLASFSQVF